MRRAILSDVHSNLEALEAVLESVAERGADSIICLGDMVGYGANPNEVVDTLRGLENVAVRGNHDHAANDPNLDSFFNRWGRAAIAWTRKVLTKENRDYLAALPLTFAQGSVRLVHASPEEPASWRYILGARGAGEQFDAFEEDLCLIGHSHVPLTIRSDAAGISEEHGNTVKLAEGARYIINVGSVGQPRDGDPRAAYGIYDDERSTIERVRVPYDHESAAGKIVEAGLPSFLADRLSRGE